MANSIAGHLAKRYIPNRIARRVRSILRAAASRRSPRYKSPPSELDGVLRCCIAYTTSGGFCVPLSSRHRPAAQAILRGSAHEPKTIRFITENCARGDIVHAGTYFGDFLPALSRACAPEARVWAFEPNPENYRCASITCAMNRLDNVELHNAGLGSRREVKAMLTGDRAGRSLGGASRVLGSESEGVDGTTESVEIVSLDAVIPDNRDVSILQLDVEGFEREVLSGAAATVKRCRPIIILENLPQRAWLSEHILRLGYSIVGQVHKNTILRAASD